MYCNQATKYLCRPAVGACLYRLLRALIKRADTQDVRLQNHGLDNAAGRQAVAVPQGFDQDMGEGVQGLFAVIDGVCDLILIIKPGGERGRKQVGQGQQWEELSQEPSVKFPGGHHETFFFSRRCW